LNFPGFDLLFRINPQFRTVEHPNTKQQTTIAGNTAARIFHADEKWNFIVMRKNPKYLVASMSEYPASNRWPILLVHIGHGLQLPGS